MSTDISLGDLVKNSDKIIAVQHDAPISEVLKLLRDDEKTVVGVTDQHDDFIGLVSAFDIMTYVAFAGCTDDHVDDNKINAVFATAIGTVTGVFHKETNRIWGYDHSATLAKILEPMCKGVHRAVVISNDKLKLISQTDLVQYAAENIDKFPIAKQKLEELELNFNKPVVTLPIDKPALHGFKRMEMEQVLALPLVNEQGSTVAVLSSSDIKRVNASNVGDILKPAGEFVKDENEQTRQPEVCKKSDTLESIINRMLAARIHHSWIVDENNVPVLTISYSDIIKLLWSVV